MDIRNQQLAKNLVNYSCNLQKGEKVLIECKGTSGIPLLNLIIKEVYKAGGVPFCEIYDETTDREILLGLSKEQIQKNSEFHAKRMSEMDAYIGIRATSNTNEHSDVDSEKMDLNQKYYYHPVHHEIRVAKTKWVVLRYPNQSMAQLSGTSIEGFKEFYYNVCNLDYAKMAEAMSPLVKLMEKTDKVRITGKGTDLSFSIKDIGVVKCSGLRNIPDGEVYTAPVKNSINGILTYNAPSLFHGFTFDNICLHFENGKIVKAEANDTERINKVFDTDEGARYIGEFAIGVNPYISKPMKDTLFDEKIKGSFHFTPGSCYEEASNGNDSAIHWDLVCIQTEEYGGGEIYFDDVLIRKNGIFVLPELECLNPESLK